jgi:flagellar export protein FliJ
VSRFVFRLDALLDLRRRERDAARRRLADALLAARAVSERSAALAAEHGDELGGLRAAGVGKLKAAELIRRRAYLGRVDERIAEVAREQSGAEEVVGRCRAELTAAERQVRLLEKLREQREAEFRADELKREERQREDAWQAVHGADGMDDAETSR